MFTILKQQKKSYKLFYGFFLLLALVGAAANVIQAVIIGDLSGYASVGEIDAILALIGFIAIIGVIRAITSMLTALVQGRFNASTGYTFRTNFAKSFLSRPFAKISQLKSGEAMSVYSNDLPGTVRLFANGWVGLLGEIVGLIILIVYMVMLYPFLTFIFFISFPVLMALQIFVSGPIQKYEKKRLEAIEKNNAIALDSLQNTSVITAYSLENHMEKRYMDSFKHYITASRNRVLAFLILIIASIVASMTPTFIIMIFLSRAVIFNNMPFADAIAFFILAEGASNFLTMLGQMVNRIQGGTAAAKRFNATLDCEDENINIGSDIKSYDGVAFSFNNISFTYEQAEKPAVSNINFQIQKGTKTAIVGASGSGKSTMLKLLLGVFEPSEGNINVFGQDIKSISKSALRKSYAYVPQDSFLFPESIGENIICTSEQNAERLRKACTDAGILEFINSLPERFNSILAESADNVSGGQKQRIAMARAFYTHAPVILFDEATSALDPVTENEVLKSFENLSKDTTIVMVAHRARAISFCDNIIVMDNGQVSAIGTHDELMENSQVYKTLYMEVV